MFNHETQPNNILDLITNRQWQELKELLTAQSKIDPTDEKAIERITFNFFSFIEVATIKNSNINKEAFLEIAKLFLDIGAHPTKKITNKYINTYANNCFESAVRNQEAELMKLLLHPQYNADLLALEVNPLSLAINFFVGDCLGLIINALDSNNPRVKQICSDGILKIMETTCSALGKHNSRLTLTQALLAKGGIPLSIDEETGQSCLHHVTRLYSYFSDFSYTIQLDSVNRKPIADKLLLEHNKEFIELVKVLLDNGADLTVTTKKTAHDIFVATPIVSAAIYKHWICVKEFAKYLIQNPDKNPQDEAQCGRALYALITNTEEFYEAEKLCDIDFLELVELLLQAGAKKSVINLPAVKKYHNKINEDYLDIAIKIKNQALCKLLLKYGVEFNFTTIKKAAENGLWDIAKILIDKNLIQKDNTIVFSFIEYGLKSLTLAAQYGQWELTKKLFDICKRFNLERDAKPEITLCLYFMLDKMETEPASIEFFDELLEFSNTMQPLIIDNLSGQKTENCIQLAIRKKMNLSIVTMLLDKAEHCYRAMPINEKITILLEALALREEYNNDNCVKLCTAKILEMGDTFTEKELKELAKILYENATPVVNSESALNYSYLVSNKLRTTSEISTAKGLINLLMTAAEFNHSGCVGLLIEKLWECFAGDFHFKGEKLMIGSESAEQRSLLPEKISLLSKNALKLLIPKLAEYPKVEAAEFRKIITACLSKHCADEDLYELLFNYLKKPQVSIISVASSVYNLGLTHFNSAATTTAPNNEQDQEKQLNEIKVISKAI